MCRAFVSDAWRMRDVRGDDRVPAHANKQGTMASVAACARGGTHNRALSAFSMPLESSNQAFRSGSVRACGGACR